MEDVLDFIQCDVLSHRSSWDDFRRSLENYHLAPFPHQCMGSGKPTDGTPDNAYFGHGHDE